MSKRSNTCPKCKAPDMVSVEDERNRVQICQVCFALKYTPLGQRKNNMEPSLLSGTTAFDLIVTAMSNYQETRKKGQLIRGTYKGKRNHEAE
jgi:hypothetical protein